MRLETTLDGARATIRIIGDVDHGNASDLEDALRACGEAGATCVVIDCGPLTFIDSTGLGLLARTSHELQARGGRVSVRNPSPFLRRLLQVSQLRGALPIDASAVQAELTERQREVLALLAEGLSNIEIAEALFINPETVKSHLRNIFDKLGVTNRTQAARYAVEHPA